MAHSFTRAFRRSAAAGVAAIALFPSLAFAQDETVDEASGASSEIVVTGTLVRGVAPPGTNVVGVTQEAVQQSGAVTTAQLLQTVPQLGSFLDLQQPAAGGNSVTANRPNLRSLPGFNTSGGSTTLVLMDGHRLVGAGVATTTPDPDVIPPGAIERLEIVPDGGSAVYGSDAVAGVLNFITRKRVNGVEANAHYGFADAYHQFDVNVTAGKDWGSGGLYFSYNYAEHDAIYGRDRDYVRQFPNTNGLTALTCAPGNVRLNASSDLASAFYGLPFTPATAVAGTPNQCDNSDDAVVYPSERRHTLFARLNQELSDAITFDVTAFYTNRLTTSRGSVIQPAEATTGLGSLGFAAHRIGAETSQLVSFQFTTPEREARLSLKTWGVTPTFTFKFGDNWQLRLMGNYGESTTLNRVPGFSAAGLTNAITNGQFNAYDPAASNPAAVAAILNYEVYGRSRQQLINTRAVLDGDLLQLPGGAVKLAAGAEFIHEGWDSRAGEVTPGYELTGFPGVTIGAATIPGTPAANHVNLSRNTKSVFGELIVPIFGAENAVGGMQELTLSAAGRYDHYSDVGGTFNPKFGLTWKPTEWLRFRGAWGKSFNAPSLADTAGADVTSLFVLPSFFGFLPSGSNLQSGGGAFPTPAPGSYIYAFRGNAPGIKPQTAKTLSLGVDIEPPFISGMKLGVTYWKIDLKGVIGLAPFQTPQVVYQNYPYLVTVLNQPNSANDLAALSALAAGAQLFPFGLPCHTNPAPCSVYAILDARKNNLGDFKVSGLDFNLAYNQETSFGSIQLAGNATYILTQEARANSGIPYRDAMDNSPSRLKLRLSAGAEVGNLFGQITWNHRSGYDLSVPVGFVPQTRVDSFDVFNLFFKYDVKGEHLFKDLSFTLNVDNVFDADPPEYRAVSIVTGASGFTNGATLGRLVQFGISKKF